MTPQTLRALPFAALFLALSAQAQTSPTPRPVTLDARQQHTLGLQTAAVESAEAAHVQASAFVTVPPGQEMVVTAPMSGTLVRLDVGLGDAVRTGTPLAVLSSPQLAETRRQLRELELEWGQARATVEREQALLNEGLIPATRLKLSQSKLAAAEAAVQAQSAALRAAGLGIDSADYAGGRILAPRAGSVVEVMAAAGQRVEPGAVLMRIADLRQLQLDIVLSGDKAARLRPGAKVGVPSHGAQATLLGVGRSLDASHQAHARARVTQPGRLQAGETVQVQVQVQETGTGARWQVPAGAVLSLQDRRWVLRAEGERLVPVPVELLSGDARTAVVQGPLQAGQKVVSSGLAALRPLLLKEQ